MTNQHLIKKQNSKVVNDEFYTQYKDIEKELINYDFTNKTIYCPCDDWDMSNFCKYFYDNFKNLKLNKLYSSCLSGKVVAYNGEQLKTYKLSSGDYNSKECLSILEHSDIVVTNPPFSSIREFMALYSKKDFIVIMPTLSLKYSTFKHDIFNWFVGNSVDKFITPEGDKKHQSCYFISSINTNRNRQVKFVSNPISSYTFVDYKNKKYLYTKTILNIPDNYYLPMIVPTRFHLFRDNRFIVLNNDCRPTLNDKELFATCLIQRISK